MWIPLSPKGELRFDALFISESLLNKKIFIMMSAILLLFSFCCTVYPEQSEGPTCAASIFSAIKNFSLSYGAFQKDEVIVCLGSPSTNILFLLSYRQASHDEDSGSSENSLARRIFVISKPTERFLDTQIV